jgi:hypothetical protein
MDLIAIRALVAGNVTDASTYIEILFTAKRFTGSGCNMQDTGCRMQDAG